MDERRWGRLEVYEKVGNKREGVVREKRKGRDKEKQEKREIGETKKMGRWRREKKGR